MLVSGTMSAAFGINLLSQNYIIAPLATLSSSVGHITIECQTGGERNLIIEGSLLVSGNNNITIKNCENLDICRGTFLGEEGFLVIENDSEDDLEFSFPVVNDIDFGFCDQDGDGIINDQDNCRTSSNPDQLPDEACNPTQAPSEPPTATPTRSPTFT